jgi:hypothetical protein
MRMATAPEQNSDSPGAASDGPSPSMRQHATAQTSLPRNIRNLAMRGIPGLGDTPSHVLPPVCSLGTHAAIRCWS